MDEDPLVWIAIIAVALLFSKFSPFYRSKKKRTALQEHEARGEAKVPAVQERRMGAMQRVKDSLFMIFICVVGLVLCVAGVYLQSFYREKRYELYAWVGSFFGF